MTTISTSDGETAAITFFGTFLTDVALFGSTLIGAAELAGVAALGVLGYHYVAGNIGAPSAPSAPAA